MKIGYRVKYNCPETFSGTTDMDVPRIDDAAVKFITAFRKGELGNLIFDSDSFRPGFLNAI